MQTVKKTYWIDGSCHGYFGIGAADFDVYVQEAMRLARLTVARLNSPTDTDFARVWNVIFKAPKEDQTKFPPSNDWYSTHRCQKDEEKDNKTALEHVKSYLEDFGHNWVRTSNRDEANVRIYSGPLSRFKVDPERPDEWVDSDNLVVLPSDWAVNGVLVPPPTYGAFMSDSYADKNVATMTICDLSWEGVMDQIPQTFDPTTFVISAEYKELCIMDIEQGFLPRVILHEFMHYSQYACEDHDGEVGSGWEHAIELKRCHAYQEADAIATLGYMAGMADVLQVGKTTGGWTLDRRWDDIPATATLKSDEKPASADKWNPKYIGLGMFGLPKENLVVNGKLLFYDDITK